MTAWKWLFAGIVCASTALAQGDAPALKQAEDAPPPDQAATTIDAVTVYRGNALVTRKVAVPEAKGVVEVVVGPLPPTVLPASLYTESGDELRVLSTRLRTRAVRDDARAEVRAKEDQVRDLKAEGLRIQAQTNVAQQGQQFFDKLEGFTAATSQNLVDRGRFDGEGIIALSKFLLQSRADESSRQVDLQLQAETNAEALTFAEKQLKEITSGPSKTVQDALILIDKPKEGAGSVRLSYLVYSATWNPQYRLRAGAADDPVRLEYFAAIHQQTGEEWTGADVTLSTAQPSLNANPPRLIPLNIFVSTLEKGQTDDSLPIRLREGEKEMTSMGGGMMGGMGGGGMGGMGGMGLSLEQLQAQDLNEVAADEQAHELLAKGEGPKADQQGDAGHDEVANPSVTFHLPARLTVAPRQDSLLIEVAHAEMTPEFFDTAIPVLSPRVYRQARLTNTNDFILLPGEATMYVGNDFVGRLSVPLVAAGEQFTVGFGVDPQVQVSRRLVDRSRTIQGGNQVRSYDFRIAVRSFRTQPTTVQVWDRLPRADSESVVVNLVKTDPELSTDASYQRTSAPTTCSAGT